MLNVVTWELVRGILCALGCAGKVPTCRMSCSVCYCWTTQHSWFINAISARAPWAGDLLCSCLTTPEAICCGHRHESLKEMWSAFHWSAFGWRVSSDRWEAAGWSPSAIWELMSTLMLGFIHLCGFLEADTTVYLTDAHLFWILVEDFTILK